MNTPTPDQTNVAQFLSETVEHAWRERSVVFCDELYNTYKLWVRTYRAGPLLHRRTFIVLVKRCTTNGPVRYGVQRRAGEVRRGFTGLVQRSAWAAHTDRGTV